MTAMQGQRHFLLACLLLVGTSWLVSQLACAFQAPLSSQRLSTQHWTASHAQLQVSDAPAPAFAGASVASVKAFQAEDESEASPFAIVAATALAAVAAESESESKGLWDKIKLPVYAGLWYFFNVQYNIQNKKLLTVFHANWAVSWFQLAAGIPIALFMWTSGLVKAPKMTKDDYLKLAPVGAAFAAGQVATVASLGAVAVSFTHVVKALEPAVNAIASALILGQVFHPMVYASLLPVFAGVALASSKELSFTMFGFLTAMASNFFFVTRNVLATKFGDVGDMGEDKTQRKTNQLAVLTGVATLVLLPVVVLLPGGLTSVPTAWKAALATGTAPNKLLYRLVASGFYFFMYQLSSFWVLSCVPPITHSVLNTLKRVVIIVVSIIVFRTPVTPQSAAGTAIAIGGVLLYSLTKASLGAASPISGGRFPTG